jgi:nucleotide-binding universal stress UspA family protein
MTRDLLLVIDSSKGSDPMISAAVQMAERGDTDLSIQILGSTPLLIPALAPLTPMYVSESEMVAWEVARIEEVRSMTATSKAVIRVDGLHDNMPVLARRIGAGSQVCDLILISGEADWEVPWLHRHAAAALILGAGTPLLMLPAAIPLGPVTHAVIGWKETAEARRTVHDLCALIEPGGQISVVTVGADEIATSDMAGGAAEVVRHLMRKGFQAASHAIHASGEGTAKALESFTAACGAQLLAIGAFSHSRLHEIALGSVTRTLLADATTPVLFCR